MWSVGFDDFAEERFRITLAEEQGPERRCNRESLWPSGEALSWRAEGRQFDSASALFSLQKLWSVDTVFVTLSLTFNETFQWLSPLPILRSRTRRSPDYRHVLDF